MLNKKAIERIEKTLGYVFENKQLISQAFTRSSYRAEHPETRDNEVLEWSGDSVLSLIVVNALCDRYMVLDENGVCFCKNESELSVLKSALVNKQYLAERMAKLCLNEYLLVSVGDELQGIKYGASVLEDLFESIVSAIYIDTKRDLNKTSAIVKRLLDIDGFLQNNESKVRISGKNDVQEWCQKKGYGLPLYQTLPSGEGFIAYCQINELGLSEEGKGHNIKEAENNAAVRVMQKLLSEFKPEKVKYSVTNDNAINKLQEHCQAEGLPLPVYEDVSETLNSDNSHTFIVRCFFDGTYIEGMGETKKDAKKQAAFNMMAYLDLIK